MGGDPIPKPFAGMRRCDCSICSASEVTRDRPTRLAARHHNNLMLKVEYSAELDPVQSRSSLSYVYLLIDLNSAEAVDNVESGKRTLGKDLECLHRGTVKRQSSTRVLRPTLSSLVKELLTIDGKNCNILTIRWNKSQVQWVPPQASNRKIDGLLKHADVCLLFIKASSAHIIRCLQVWFIYSSIANGSTQWTSGPYDFSNQSICESLNAWHPPPNYRWKYNTFFNGKNIGIKGHRGDKDNEVVTTAFSIVRKEARVERSTWVWAYTVRRLKDQSQSVRCIKDSKSEFGHTRQRRSVDLYHQPVEQLERSEILFKDPDNP